MMDAISTRIKAITRLVTQLTAKWVEIGTTLQNEMHLLGDVNQDGKITQADAEAVMNILSGELAETPMNYVLGNTTFGDNLSYVCAQKITEVANGKSTMQFTYATVFEYAGAEVGDYVDAVFIVAGSGGSYKMPTYAYVAKPGIIGICSNEMIPVDMEGSIKLLKGSGGAA